MSLVSVNWNPSRQTLRSFGTICLVAFGALGALVYYRQKFLWIEMAPPTAHIVAYVLWAAAIAGLILGQTVPMALRPVYIGLTAVSLPIGFVLSHVIMAVIFYGVFTPIALIFRLIGRDPLERRFDPQATSFWTRRELITDTRRYYRQF